MLGSHRRARAFINKLDQHEFYGEHVETERRTDEHKEFFSRCFLKTENPLQHQLQWNDELRREPKRYQDRLACILPCMEKYLSRR